jgi:osmoprotectant transport system ATP-binding protein
MIVLDNVRKQYAGAIAPSVDGISATVAEGETLVLLGESGCGKTTTLKMVNRLLEPTSGSIHVDGHDASKLEPTALRRSIGYVFQGIGLFPHMTVAQNIATVPRLLRWNTGAIDQRVDEVMETVGLALDEHRHRYPGELSGGQRQRVGVARALAARPTVMLMDEPFGALDPITRDELQREFSQIRRTLNLTVMLVTHDMTEALLLGDRIAVMRAGRIVQQGTPHQLLVHPEDEYVQRLMETPKRQADQLEALAAPDDGTDRTP